MAKRSPNLIKVGYYLSRFGRKNPPSALKSGSWQDTYYSFFEKLSGGREISTFLHSLKNSRDEFDSHFPETSREGWKTKEGEPRKFGKLTQVVFDEFEHMSEDDVWNEVSIFLDTEAKSYLGIFKDLEGIEESEKEFGYTRTEGGRKYYISSKAERSPKLRAEALRIHGHDCMVCGFNFASRYGVWGENWAEVHHLVPLSEKKDNPSLTNPKTDLVVLCANCHRMVHRKKGITLTIDELKAKLK